MTKITLTYDPINGHAVPDGKIDTWIDDICNMGGGEISVGTETMFQVIRARHVEGTLEIAELITFRVEGSTTPGDWIQMAIDDNGNIDDWPKGFCDTTENALFRIMTARKKGRKQV